MIIPTILATTQVLAAEGWTGKGLESDINKKIIALEQSINPDKYEIKIKDIKVTPEWGYAYIIYDINEKKAD
jgi:hypothetical protein